MLRDRFYGAIDDLYARIRETQNENISKTAALVAETAARGGGIHVFDTGHIISQELIGRAGGFVMYKQLKYAFTVDDAVRRRPAEDRETSMEGLSEYVLRKSNVLPGDLLFIGSVSGKTMNVIDLAITAKQHGVKVVVITSIEYSSGLTTPHSSGLRLFEIGDVVLDNCTPPKDAMLEVEGLDAGLCPASGMAAAYIMWAVTAEACELMLNSGITPSVYMSHNCPEGPDFNVGIVKAYEQNGY